MQHVPNQGSMNAERHEESETRLQGRLLRLAQAAWILVALLSFILFVVSLPAFYTQTQSICTGDACNGVQVSPEQAQALAAHGISFLEHSCTLPCLTEQPVGTTENRFRVTHGCQPECRGVILRFA